jgi:Flp pilus assembly protein TadD
MRRYDESMELSRKALDLEPSSHAAHNLLAASYMQKHMYENAVQEQQEAIRLSGQSPMYIGELCALYSLAGRRSEALKVLDQLKQLEKKKYVTSMSFVFAYIGLGNKEKAMEYLEKSYDTRDFPVFCYQKVDPIFDSVSSDPRFQEIVRRMNFPEK